MEQQPETRWPAVLWFVAAALTGLAIGIRFFRGREFHGALAAAGLFCVVMGITQWKRGASSPG